MGFTTKRGRPKTVKTENLKRPKRIYAKNQEVLDVLRAKSLITSEELWAGIHLRWLYTIKFGAPGISAGELEHFYGRELKLEDPVWQKNLEKEYRQAINELREIKAHKIVMNIAIFNMYPKFLDGVMSLKNTKRAAENHREFKYIINGLSLLCELWGKENSRYKY